MFFRKSKKSDTAMRRRRNGIEAFTSAMIGVALFVQSMVFVNYLTAAEYGTLVGGKKIGCGTGADDSAAAVILLETESFWNGIGGGKGSVDTLWMIGASAFHNGVCNGTGTVKQIEMLGGTFYNGESGTGTVENLIMLGGTFHNGSSLLSNDNLSAVPAEGTGTVKNMTFYGGEYDHNDKSTLTNLTLGKHVDEQQGEKFGTVDNLTFTSDYGLVTITGTADGGYRSDINVKADKIDLTGVSLQLDLSELYVSPDAFVAAFHSLDFDAILNGMLVAYYGEVTGSEYLETLWLFGNRTYYKSYSDVLAAAAGSSNDMMGIQSNPVTPEPASVLLFGFGLAGLAAARRKRK